MYFSRCGTRLHLQCLPHTLVAFAIFDSSLAPLGEISFPSRTPISWETERPIMGDWCLPGLQRMFTQGGNDLYLASSGP
jgi:hypothetical protein